MMYILFFISLLQTILGQRFNTSSSTNDIFMNGQSIYVTTTTETYLLDKSLSQLGNYSKNFKESVIFYVSDDFLFECGERKTDMDVCCVLRDPVSLLLKSSTNDADFCLELKSNRFFYPCYQQISDKWQFYFIISCYKAGTTCNFARIWFSDILNASLTKETKYFQGNSVPLRSRVLSPSPQMLENFVVAWRSSYHKQALYLDPTIEHPSTSYGSLSCDKSDTNVTSAFALKSDTDLGLLNGDLNATRLTHFLLYYKEPVVDNNEYRICVFEEEKDLYFAGSQRRPVDVEKSSLMNLTIDAKFSRITSFNGIIVNGGIVMYYLLGSSVYKMALNKGDTQIRELGEVHTSSSPLKKIEFLDPDTAVVLGEDFVEVFVPERCDQYQSCEACHTLSDPHCGWCTLENKCSTKGKCLESTLWTQQSGQCLEMSIDDANKDIIALQDLTVTVSNIDLPVDKVYECQFTYPGVNGSVVSDGTYEAGGQLKCAVPDLANIKEGLTELEVTILYNKAQIGSLTFNYHRCDLYSQCGDCSGISTFCTWCPLEGKCNKQEDALCITSKVNDPSTCPRITEVHKNKLSRDSIQDVRVSVSNLPNFTIADVYQCKVTSKLDGSVSKYFDLGDDSKQESIVCKDVQFDVEFPEYNKSESVLDMTIIYRGGQRRSDINVATGLFSIYACELLAADCVKCVTTYANDPYSCRFCTTGNSCSVSNSKACEGGLVISSEEKNQCFQQNTKITEVIPDWSPGEGGVPITLKGTSLATDEGQIEIQFVIRGSDGVELVVPCEDSKIRSSQRIECTTPDIMAVLGYQTLHEETIATIVIKYIGDSIMSFKSSQTFTFTRLQISDIVPGFGPLSGGTRITLNGTRICVPEHTKVTVGQIPCLDVRCNFLPQTVDCTVGPGTGSQPVQVILGDAVSQKNSYYEYLSDPTVEVVSPLFVLRQGGLNISVNGSNFGIIQQPVLTIRHDGLTGCHGEDVTEIQPVERSTSRLIFTLPPDQNNSYSLSFKMDGVTDLCDKSWGMVVTEEPSVISSNFEDNILSCSIGDKCVVNITMTEIHRFGDQVKVSVGALECNGSKVIEVKTKTSTTGVIGRISCEVPSIEEIQAYRDDQTEEAIRTKRAIIGDELRDQFQVKIKIGLYTKDVGRISFVEKGFQMIYIYIVAAVVLLFILISVGLVVKNRNDRQHMVQQEKKNQKEKDNLEAAYANAARKEFTEMTLMTDRHTNVKIDPRDIPYRIFCDYLVHIMFPNVDKRKILSKLQMDAADLSPYTLTEFSKFLSDEQFLVTFIEVIEKQKEFQVTHRCEVASYLTIALYSDFFYLSRVLFRLLDKITTTEISKSPKLLLRATKSVAEKLLTNWLSLSLYDYLCSVTGPSFYDLCYKIALTVEKGPLDFVTHQARYALNQDKILSEEVEFKMIEVLAEGPDGTRASGKVSVLDCDTITQIKGKLYRAIYPHQPFSQQPQLEALSLLWTPASGQGPGSLELCDYDDRMTVDSSADKKYNTLKTYKVQSNDLLKLTMFNEFHQANMSTIRSVKRQTVSEVCRYHLVKSSQYDMDYRSPAPNKRTTVSTVQPTKIASEAYLSSLIRTKDHLSKNLDSLMTTIFMESNNIPAAIKFLFDYLDQQTQYLNEKDRQDKEIAHVWKTNSLPLRFWINILKNPQFLFDIDKPPIMDSYLSVIGQCFMDSFSLANVRLNKDCPANKLVYNREVTEYRGRVDKWYKDVAQLPPVPLQTVVSESKLPPLPFKSKFAVSQLFEYAVKYQGEITEALPSHGQSVTKSDFEVLMKPGR